VRDLRRRAAAIYGTRFSWFFPGFGAVYIAQLAYPAAEMRPCFRKAASCAYSHLISGTPSSGEQIGGFRRQTVGPLHYWPYTLRQSVGILLEFALPLKNTAFKE
jgi:hypothetical protein